MYAVSQRRARNGSWVEEETGSEQLVLLKIRIHLLCTSLGCFLLCLQMPGIIKDDAIALDYHFYATYLLHADLVAFVVDNFGVGSYRSTTLQQPPNSINFQVPYPSPTGFLGLIPAPFPKRDCHVPYPLATNAVFRSLG